MDIAISIPGLSADPTFSINYSGDFAIGSSVCQQPTSCSVHVTFSPQLPGFRKAALIVKNTTGTVVATALLSGLGLGPEIAIYPGTIATVPGTNNGLWDPEGIAVDPAGNLFVSDTVHEAIRLVSGGFISTVSMTGVTLAAPTGLALDGAGNIYVADAQNNVVVEINAFTARGAVVAGGGHPSSGSVGDGGPATSGSLSAPSDVAVDGLGNLYIADTGNGLIRKVDTSGNISTVAGADGSLASPRGIALDPGGNVLYIADTGHHAIRSVVLSAPGVTVPFAGNGNAGYSGDGGLATQASLESPVGVKVDAAGNVYIADSGLHSNAVREVSAATGAIITIAGNGTAGLAGDGGSPLLAELNAPNNLGLDGAGHIFITDTGNNLIREVTFGAQAMTFNPVTAGLFSAPQSQTVFNIGNKPLNFSALNVPAGFREDPSNSLACTATSVVAAGGSCVLPIESVPGAAGATTGTLAFSTNAGSQAISLSGSGVSGPVPQIQISPSALTFASQAVGSTSAAQTLTITNTGSATLNISSIWLTGANATAFQITGNTCGTVAARSSCTVSVSFAPTALGSQSAAIAITDALASSPQMVGLSGVAIPSGSASIDTAAVTFPPTMPTATSLDTLTLSNSGTTTLEIISITLNGANASDFSVASGCTSALLPGLACQITISFRPLTSGLRTASLTIATSSMTGAVIVSLSGLGAGQYVPGNLAAVSAGSANIWGITSGNSIYTFDLQSQTWRNIPGWLSKVVAGNDGSVWGLGFSGSIYRFNSSSQKWDNIPGVLTDIALGADGDTWGLNNGSIYHFDRSAQSWSWIQGLLSQIAVGFDGAVWGINLAGQIYRFNVGLQRFEQVPGWLSTLAVGADGDVWGINPAGHVYHFSRSIQNWESIQGNMATVSVGSADSVWALDASGGIFKFDEQTQGWVQVTGALKHISAIEDGSMWGLDAAGQIYIFDVWEQTAHTFHQIPGLLHQVVAASDGNVWGLASGNQIYYFNPLTGNWRQMPGLLSQLAVGTDGNVWGINAGGYIYRFNSATQNWDYIPGLLTQLSVGGDGSVWGINRGGYIYRFNAVTQKWDNIPGLLTQLSVGADGSVWGINSGGSVYRLNSQAQTWNLLPGHFTQVIAGSNNNVWALDAAGNVFHWNVTAYSWQAGSQQFASVAAAFDGAASAIDANGNIYNFDAQSQQWVQIPGLLSQITIGSGTTIWGITASGSIYRYW